MNVHLDRYACEHEISARQHAAGTRLAVSCRNARRYLRCRANPMDRDGARQADRAEAVAVADLLRRLPEHRDVLLSVIGKQIGASSWAFEAGRRRAEGMPALVRALDALADLYAEDDAGAVG